MKKIIFSLLTLMTMLVSCTDQEDIEITYKSQVNVSAAHLFSCFHETMEGDFDIKGNSGEWLLNLHAFIYDKDGILVKSVENQYESLEETMSFDLNVNPGEYSIVAIADFQGKGKLSKIKFWNIDKKENLNDLSITESLDIFTTPFETLGIYTNKISITDKPETFDIDIQPVTGLVEILFWDGDYSGMGSKGYSSYAPKSELISIRVPKLKQTVKFNGINPTYEYGAQDINFILANHSPKEQYLNNGPTQVLTYRALLPIDDRDFFWELTSTRGSNIFGDHLDFHTSDMTTKIDVISGKQYVMDLLLDNTYLYVCDYDPDVDMFDRIEGYFNENNKNAFDKIMDRNFDEYIGYTESQIVKVFGKPEKTDNMLIYTNYNDYVTILGFVLDETTNLVKAINVTFSGTNKEFSDHMISYLTKRFNVFEKGTDQHQKAFIDGKDLQSSNIGVIWYVDTTTLNYVKLN